MISLGDCGFPGGLVVGAELVCRLGFVLCCVLLMVIVFFDLLLCC